MKKRLLSAFLALAMVLTLLPATIAPVSAATITTQTPDQVTKSTVTNADGTTTTTKFYQVNGTSVTSVTVTRCATDSGDGRAVGKWYWEDNVNKVDGKSVYYEVTSGIIAGNNGSGTWYPATDFTMTDANGKKSLRSTTFTLLGTENLAVGSSSDDWASNSISINADIAGGGALTLGEQVTSATVTSKFVYGTPTGTVTVTARDHSTYDTAAPKTNGLVLTATNVKVGAIDLKGRVNTITLNDCDAGSVKLDGTTITSATDSNVKTYNNQTLTVNGGKVTGTVEVANATPAVSLTNCSGVTTVTYSSTSGGSFTVAGTTAVTGAFAVTPRDKTSTYPTVNINGGSVNGITQVATASSGDANGNSITVGINNSGASVTGAISIEKGTLNIASGKASSTVAVKEGTLNISGSGVSTGQITLGEKGNTNLSISAANSTFTGIAVATDKGGNLKTVTWPAGRGNNYGTLDLGSYAGHGVKGGTFSSTNASSTFGAENSLGWFDTSLQYYSVPKTSTSSVALYGRDELAVAIAESNNATSGAAGTGIAVLGQGTNAKTLTLKNGDAEWAKIGYNTTTGFVLPTQINTVKVGSWIVDKEGSDTGNLRSFVAGSEVAISCPADGMTLNANPNGTAAIAEKLTNATNASGTNNNVVNNSDVKVTLSGNNINLTGAVTSTAGGYATVTVTLTTDVLNTTTGKYQTLDVDVLWNVEKKTFQFDQSAKLDFGAIIDANGDLVLNNGVGTHYTVSGNLAVSAGNLYIVEPSRAGETIVGAVGGSLSSRNDAQKKVLIDAIETDSEFDYSGSPAFREAVNAAQASITSTTTVDGWINTARTTVWRNGYKDDTQTNGYKDGMVPHSTTYSTALDTDNKVTDAFSNAYIVPYLLVTATNETQTGELTLTVQPYYRVDVSAATYDPDVYYTVQTGRALSLSGDMGDGVELTLSLAALNNIDTDYMHQDGKYVYAESSSAYTITHIGANGTLGTMVLNSTDGLIELTPATGSNRTATCKYDDLQAAIDDTGVEVNGGSGTIAKDKVTVPGSYTGSCNVTMTGYARTIDVDLGGLHTLTWSGAELSVTKSDATGIYTLQLKKDTAPTGGNITVSSATGGSASVSANPATAGQTVTVTLSPSAGYASSGVSVKTSTGTTVSVSGSGNTYTFTMPSGAVTVTPSFTASQTRANIYVGNPSTGSGTAVTTAGSSQVAPGTTVTVTTTPGSGQRTMGLSVTGATAVRTGVNQFQFTVPSGYTTVTVVPSFDTNNGTYFSDVWSSEYYSPAVAWAVGRGVTNGTSTYTFSPNSSCTREDMVTFLYRAAGSPAVGNVTNPFWDVVPGSYYYNAVMWAVSKGITNGVSANQFGVGQTVTRGQAVTFLYRYEGSPAASTSSGFYDVPTSEYYAKAVSWAKTKGVTNGTTATTFGPNEYCLRGQIVTFLYRDINNIRA